MKITFPESIKTIGETCFYGCTKLQIFGKIIPKNAFLSCSTLKEIIISPNTTIIGQDSFRECTSLIKITIPKSVTIINDHAFQGCTSLTEITTPSSVSSIGDNTFSDYKKISSDFKYTGSMQSYRIPTKGVYQIKAVGASGSGGNTYRTSYQSFGGKGAEIIGKFSLNIGDIIDIVVERQGKKKDANASDGASGGGGGGTFIFKRIKSITSSRYQFTQNQTHLNATTYPRKYHTIDFSHQVEDVYFVIFSFLSQLKI